MKPKNATFAEGCSGCQHRDNADGDAWCYMFLKSPDKLPCAQHDKFAELRKRAGKHTNALMFITGDFP